MKYDIQSAEDENFKIEVKQFGEHYVASDGERVTIAVSEEQAVEGVKEIQTQNEEARGPKPAPIQNKVYSGTGWFEGTPWSTNNR
jgi:hypothetical protein